MPANRDFIETQPLPELLQFLCKALDADPMIRRCFVMHGQYTKSTLLSVCFQINASDDLVTNAKRQHIVTPPALCRRHIDLYAVVEFE